MKKKLTVTSHRTSNAEIVGGWLVSILNASRPVQVDADHGPSVVLHPTDYSSQHRQIYTISVHVAMLLLPGIRGQSHTFPNIQWNQARRLIECW